MDKIKKVADVLIFNNQAQLALQLRATHDKSFPAHWDFSAAGGIKEGEDPEVAVKREAFEELGVSINPIPIGIESHSYRKWNSEDIKQVEIYFFKAAHNGPFKPDPKEVDQVCFFNLVTIEEMLRSGEKFHPEFEWAWDQGIIHNQISF